MKMAISWSSNSTNSLGLRPRLISRNGSVVWRTKMTAGGKKKTADEFWSKVLSATKVKRILEKRGFNAEAFRKDYEADTSRGPRAPKRPNKAQLDAVEAFQNTGDFDALKVSLGTQSAAVANSALRRVLQFKARGGVKTVRRPAAARE
jgi:hypothetical protein